MVTAVVCMDARSTSIRIITRVQAATSFSLMPLIAFFGEKLASCPVILRPSARSNLAPRASFEIWSFFSSLTV